MGGVGDGNRADPPPGGKWKEEKKSLKITKIIVARFKYNLIQLHTKLRLLLIKGLSLKTFTEVPTHLNL